MKSEGKGTRLFCAEEGRLSGEKEKKKNVQQE